MEQTHFDLYKGADEQIVLPESKDSLISTPSEHILDLNHIKKKERSESIFIEMEKKSAVIEKEKKKLDFAIPKNIKFKSSSQHPGKNHGFFAKIKNSSIFAIALIGLFILANGFVNALDKKEKLTFTGQKAVSSLEKAAFLAKDGDFSNAINAFSEAEIYFQETEDIITPINHQISHIDNFNSDINAADNLIKFGEEISVAGKEFLEIAEEVGNFTKNYDLDQNLLTFLNENEAKITNLKKRLDRAHFFLEEANYGLVGKKFKNEIYQAQTALKQILISLEKIEIIFPKIKTLLGDRYPHTVLVLLQNSHEIRANGGFIGSMLFITFNDGKITKVEFKDVYDIDSNLSANIEAPRPFQAINVGWGLRDANYYPDFPKSAEKIQWFLEKAKHDSVDTIVAIDEQFIEEILKVTGPLNLPEVNIPINSDNFSFVLSFFVEAKIFAENNPKKVINDLLPQFTKKIKEASATELANVFFKMSKEKHLQAFSFRSEAQEIFDELEISGRFVNDDNQKIKIIQTSISGNKSDGYIDEKIYNTTFVKLNGEVVEKIKITRSHNWNEKDQKAFDELYQNWGIKALHDRESLLNIMGAGKNQVYTRIYMPKHSLLKNVKGLDKSEVEIYKENDFTVFAFFFPLTVKASSEEVELEIMQYQKLDFDKNFDKYKLCFEKSAGIEKNYFEKDFLVEGGLKIKNQNNYPYKEDIYSEKCFEAFIGKESKL